ncbi:hypothetical protein QTO34_010963 [Cnephaeus nilssonii]|uniref:Uncharacterized protein n=1 Tax=Cnephaeus nilssonii TaxID=3371016 RepID=A0AA40HCK8_CNENI|nr:hypothetical protein QTO34_010963 [Eptesicus nilssonii]
MTDKLAHTKETEAAGAGPGDLRLRPPPAYSSRYSQAVSHPSTIQARPSLGSQIGPYNSYADKVGGSEKSLWGEGALAPHLELVYLVTALVPSDTACLASSPGSSRRTAVWISRDVMVERLL